MPRAAHPSRAGNAGVNAETSSTVDVSRTIWGIETTRDFIINDGAVVTGAATNTSPRFYRIRVEP